MELTEEQKRILAQAKLQTNIDKLKAIEHVMYEMRREQEQIKKDLLRALTLSYLNIACDIRLKNYDSIPLEEQAKLYRSFIPYSKQLEQFYLKVDSETNTLVPQFHWIKEQKDSSKHR